ncbi:MULTISPECIES: L,D-transpeptidase [unclassified Roseitalea]|uniref:L,D-transpeptidase n=1 Tax=unclassified Roseitalea TaxID=2639107 RepID=UPI00273DE5D1|nr:MULTISPECIES: L,D-transpeptidase [unclassified Roseitalea]
MNRSTRRNFLGIAAGLPLAVAGCTTTVDETTDPPGSVGAEPLPFGPGGSFPPYERMYASVTDGGFTIPAVPYQNIDPRFLRQEVRNTTGEPEGTIVVETGNHFLYYVLPGGRRAVRYGVGLGRAGFEWSGSAVVGARQRWPKWFPPAEMIEREPELEKYRGTDLDGDNVWEGGMPPGVMNPLGARALYVYQDGKDTLYRLHGSPEWNSIGKSVSSGCVRLMNQDIIDLYARAPLDTPIIVRSAPGFRLI